MTDAAYHGQRARGTQVALLLLALGCNEAQTPAPAASAPPATAASARPLRYEEIALAPPKGARPIDGQIVALQQRLEVSPDLLDDWVLLGRAWINKAREAADHGLYHAAEACAQIVLQRDPKNLLAQNLIAQVMLEEHRFLDARVVAQEILASYPHDVNALGTLSDAMLELGRYDEAIEAADEMNDLKPGLPSYGRAAYLKWLRGDVDGALESFRAAAEAGRDPTEPEPRVWAIVQSALVFWHKGDLEGADAGAKLALKELPGHPAALALAGRVAHARGDAEHAAELLQQSFDAYPTIETAWRLGDARAAAGDQPGAEKAYATIRPGEDHDKRTAAQFFAAKDRRIDDAVRLARAEIETRPGIYTWDALAWALYRAGKLDEAQKASDEAMRLGTKDGTLLFHAGAIRIARGDEAEGKNLVRAALAMNRHFDVTGAGEAAKLLAEE
jgi:tetratricopeptide (TPR) repeat protein